MEKNKEMFYENRHLLLEVLRHTECKQFLTIGVISFTASRQHFFNAVKKFGEEANKKEILPFDKIIAIGKLKGYDYYRIQLIKFV